MASCQVRRAIPLQCYRVVSRQVHRGFRRIACMATGWLLVAMGSTGCSTGPETAHAPAYVGGQTCAGCHEEAALAWQGSDHDRAMEEATPESVLGDFDDAAFYECGVETRFSREGDRFFIHTQGRDGRTSTFPVAYTFGYDPLQQYLVPTEGGRMQAFTIAWDTHRARWFSLTPEECIEPPDWLHWTGDGMNWNYMCADCHSTDLQRRFDPIADAYETTFSEIDVSCEACHGPGEAHVRRARLGAYDPDDSGLPTALSTPHRQIDACAPCHSRRRVAYPDYAAGNPFLDHYDPALLEEDLYFPDGQIQDEVYVYGSFLQSRMHAAAVTCSDCHDPHSTEPKLEGNALCGQCHEPATFDTFDHIRHPAGSEGSQCVDCHMPERTYMVVDPRRDHGFGIPRPDLAVRLGTPDACSGCHVDRSAAWAADRVAEWHGPDRPASFALALAGGRAGDSAAEPELIRIVDEREVPDIVRATALNLLARYPTVRAGETAVEALTDASPLMRVAALRRLGMGGDRSVVSRVLPLLADSVRLVRMEAARMLLRTAPDRFDRDETGALQRALEEFRQGQDALSDQAAAHVNLAIMHEQMGHPDSAAAAYRMAIRVDSSFVPAYLNLAMLLNRMRGEEGMPGEQGEEYGGYGAETEAMLRAAMRIRPDVAEVPYALGLFLAEMPGRLGEAAQHLTRAAELDATNARVHYNAGLAHQRLGDSSAAERLLQHAHRLAPEAPDYLDALSILYAQQEDWALALRYTDRLLQVVPDDPALLQRKSWIERQGG